MELHPRLANALVHACKQRGDWWAYKSPEARRRRDPDHELTARLTKTTKHTAEKLIKLGLAEPADPGYPTSKTVFGSTNERWITITPLGREVAERRFNRSNSASMPFAGL